MESEPHEYCLRWNNHRTNLLNVFSGLLENEVFTDVTIVVEDVIPLKCHKIVLAACSSYFQKLFFALPCKHPVIVLKDVRYFEIKAILKYMYHGEVNVAQEHLYDLMKVATALKVKGLIAEEGSLGSLQDYFHHEDRHHVETSMSPPPAISTSTGGTIAHSSAHNVSPSHSIEGAYGPYIKSAIDHEHNRLALSMWSMTGLHTGHQSVPHSSTPAALGRAECNNGFENVSLKRRKVLQPNLLMNRDNTAPILRTVLGQSHADSSQGVSRLPPEDLVSFRSNSNGSANDNENRRGNTHSEMAYSPRRETTMDEDQKSPSSHPGDTKSGITNCGGHKEWKRYKQYTRKDIVDAIDAVRGGMSAVQAARKHGVPSRTLYDKVKKLGITTSRPFRRSTTNGSSSACFPYGIGGNVNGRIYGSALCENETENSSINATESTPGRGTAVYTKVKDTSQDRDSALDSIARCTSSPVIRCAKQKQQQESIEDQVEDLSVSRKSDVIVPPSATSNAIKVEAQDNIAEPDNSPADCCDYN